jgi:hypothetical protein
MSEAFSLHGAQGDIKKDLLSQPWQTVPQDPSSKNPSQKGAG